MKRTRKNNWIAIEGYPFIGLALILFVLSSFLYPLASIPFLILLLFVIYFFRNPRRSFVEDPKKVISAADGKVLEVTEVDENRIIHRRAKKVSIFMSPLNVHVNKIPLSGTVKKVVYNKGKFLTAFHEKASLDNEQNAVLIENESGKEVLFVQIAGWLARRIVCYAKEGELWKQGDIYGLIRFGSRVDFYLPLDSKIEVKEGDTVKSGETVIASL